MKKRTAIIILVCAVILTAIIQEGLGVVVTYNTPIFVLSSITIWYSALYLFIDIYYSVQGVVYNRKRIGKDVILIMADLLAIIIWNYVRIYTTSWLLDTALAVLIIVLTVSNMFDKWYEGKTHKRQQKPHNWKSYGEI